MRQAPKSEILARAAALRAQKEAAAPAAVAVKPKPKPLEISPDVELPDWMTDTLEEVPRDTLKTIDSDEFMRSVVDGLDILTAYDKYCGKKRDAEPRGDEVMASCPTPSHADSHPSACLNIAKNQWTCYGCRAGGDVLSLVGGFLGLDPRVPVEYMKLTKSICRDLGYSFWTDAGGHERIVMPEAAPLREVLESSPPEAEALRQQEPVVEHGSIDDLPEIFDMEEAHEKGELTKPEPVKLTEDTAWLADTLDEMNDIGGKTMGGESKHDSIMGKLKAKLGKALENNPVPDPIEEKKAEVIAKIAPELAKPAPVAEPAEPKKKRVNPFLAAADKIVAGRTDKSNSETPEPDREIIVDEAPIFTDTPSIDWRNIFPENTFIHDYMTHAVVGDDCVEEFHVWNAIAAVGMALMKDVALNDKPLVYGNLFICDVARSGGRKSKPGAMLMDILTRAFPYDAESGGGLMVPVPPPSSGESLIDVFVNEQEDPLSTTTPKGVITHRVHGLMEVPELSGLVNVATRNGNVLESVLINLYDCRPEVTTTSRGSGIKKAKDPFCSMLTAVQPKLLQSLVTEKMVVSGFANRFVWVFGPEKTEIPMGSIDSTEAGVGHLVLKIKQLRETMTSSIPRHPWSGNHVMNMDPESMRLFEKFHYETMVPTKAADDSDLAVRVNLLMKKLILIFTANMGKSSVPPEAVEQAIKLWPYLIACYARVGSQINSTVMREAEQRVLDGVVSFTKKHQKGPTRRELWNSSIKNYKPIESRDVLGKLMATMVKDGILEELEPKANSRGLPQPRYISTRD